MKKMNKILGIMFAFTLVLLLAGPALAAPPLVVDQAGLLSEADAAALEQKLTVLSDRHQADIAVVTVDSIGDYTPEAFADDYFDYNGYGRGDNYDGLLLLVSMEERDWCISTCGKAIDAFTDAGVSYLGAQIVSDLGSGEYAQAFNLFADWCDKFFVQAANGKPFDEESLPKTTADLVFYSIIGLIGGLIVAAIITRIMKRSLKTVQNKHEAADYVQFGSMQVTRADEQFLHRNVTRTRIEKPSSSSGGGGGSSTHTSSSGRSHGGGSGKF